MTSPFTPSWKQNKTKQNKTKPDNKNYNGKQSAQTNEWNVFKN